MSTQTVQEVQTAGAVLWTVSQGAGLPVVLCHGGPGLSDNLGPLACMIDDLARVHRYDQRGSGRSRANDGFDVDTFIADLEALRTHWGHPKWVVGGHSWGANLALFYALAHPKHTLGVIYLAGTGLRWGWQQDAQQRRLARLSDTERAEIADLQRQLAAGDTAAIERFLRLMWITDFADRRHAHVLDEQPLYRFARDEHVFRTVTETYKTTSKPASRIKWRGGGKPPPIVRVLLSSLPMRWMQLHRRACSRQPAPSHVVVTHDSSTRPIDGPEGTGTILNWDATSWDANERDVGEEYEVTSRTTATRVRRNASSQKVVHNKYLMSRCPDGAGVAHGTVEFMLRESRVVGGVVFTETSDFNATIDAHFADNARISSVTVVGDWSFRVAGHHSARSVGGTVSATNFRQSVDGPPFGNLVDLTTTVTTGRHSDGSGNESSLWSLPLMTGHGPVHPGGSSRSRVSRHAKISPRGQTA